MTTVDTSSGRVRGIDRGTGLAFYGIPYAGPAGAEARWRVPSAAPAWTGVRDAVAPGFAAPQPLHPVPGFAASGPQDEDCLNLNVFTPAADGRRRPVLFWIHGGGFTHGAGSELLYDGGPLALRGDVVVVTINYRLGALGYLYLEEHLPGHGLTANAGLLDQVAALEWVRDNIAAFGGDPGAVTIFGQSAGAAAVGTLLVMPAARGLFRRAILQSGAGRASDAATAAGVADALLAELGLDRAQAAGLLTLPAQAIVEAQARLSRGGPLRFGPAVDGATLPAQPVDAVRAGMAAHVPLLVGTNRDEVKQFVAMNPREPIDDDALARAVRASLGGQAGDETVTRVIAAHRRSREALALPATNLDIMDAVDTNARFRANALRLAVAQREHQPRTYVYLFVHESPARRGALGACHSLEMPFVFGTLDAPTQDRFAGTGPEVERLSAEMMDAWLSFARTGNPAHEGIGAWPAYDAERRSTMVFGHPSTVVDDPLAEERAVIESA